MSPDSIAFLTFMSILATFVVSIGSLITIYNIAVNRQNTKRWEAYYAAVTAGATAVPPNHYVYDCEDEDEDGDE